MNENNSIKAEMSLPPPRGRPEALPRMRPIHVTTCLALVLCFGIPLYRLVRFALQSDLYSYVLLIPFVSMYLFGVRKSVASTGRGSNRTTGAILIGIGLALLGCFWTAVLLGAVLVPQDSLAISTFSFILLLAGFLALFLDAGAFRAAVFPLAFLLFMIPFPVAMEQAIETSLQRGSAPPAFWFFQLAGTPVFKQDMVFQLPGMTLQIAPECSGIRSTIVLLMTSLVAGHMFLRSPWKRVILTLAVLPLALLRNGFRVFVIGELCVHVGPHMIDSPIHHYGGSIFFALSLIPFSILVYYLVKSDRSPKKSDAKPIAS